MQGSELFPTKAFAERKERAKKIVAYLKKTYPVPKSELLYETPFQFVASVILSAQATDKMVNLVTAPLWKKYRTIDDFADADLATFTKEISSISFYQNKAKYVLGAAQYIREHYAGEVPKTESELVKLPGVAYKTAHVVLGELYGVYEGIPTDTHVRRFAIRFDLVDSRELTKISKELEMLIPKEDWRYVNNGLVLYGRYVCSAIPHPCEDHPLTKIWPAAARVWPKAR